MKAASPGDYRELARRRLPRFLFDYIDGGSYAEVTLDRNVSDLRRVTLRQRVLHGTGNPDLSTTLFGQKMAMPIILGPVGLAGMNARRGEVQAARAAHRAGIQFTLSTLSVCTIGEVAGAVERPIWFQLYVTRDRSFMRDLLAQAKAARCSGLVFTVDIPVAGTRYRDYRSGLAGAPGLGGSARRGWQAVLHPRWAWDVGIWGRPHHLGNVAPLLAGKTGLEDFFRWIGDNFDSTIAWKDLEFIRSEWKGPLIIKGILEPGDATEAAALGADGIVVSNHGGRQLDGALSTIRALPPIVDAIGDQLTVLCDGGARSGIDVVRMLALGAKGVMLGRAWVYALGSGGEAKVSHVLKLFEAEMRVAMILTGADSVEKLRGVAGDG
ncbi:MAG TPA: FMN-dependent L-lactate dehydrogenase LldD [Candidatus Binataceae bacterium]|nr:FMN-dependent L-lactate dehydrogenase LldD [Candidatus Binataceae bacterium]